VTDHFSVPLITQRAETAHRECCG